MKKRIRFATPHDFSAIEDIENLADQMFIDLFNPTSWDPAPSASSRAAEPGFLLVAVNQEDEVVGFIHIIEIAEIAHLEQISVRPNYGNLGYGSELLTAAKVEAHSRGYQRLTLRTYADVPWNAPFYQLHGFIEEKPATPFHLELLIIEANLGLERYGQRIQMYTELK